MIDFVKNSFNKASFANISFSDFKKTYKGKMKGYDITKVAELLGIDTTEKKVLKPKSVGKIKK